MDETTKSKMTWGPRILLGFSAVLMWFVTSAFYGEFGYDADPEGMFGALTALFVVGPVLAGLFTWAIAARYRKETNDQKRMRLLAAALATPLGLLLLGQMLLT